MTATKIILITGSSSGMGLNMVKTLAAQGYRVYAGMRDITSRHRQVSGALREFAVQKGLDIRPVELDVLSDTAVTAVMEKIESESGGLDILVNNAGILLTGVTEAFTLDQVRQQMEVNFIAPMRMYRAVLPLMHRQQQGLVINITSVAGRLVFPFMGLYCASKYALDAVAECYRYELSASKIDSVSIEPGPFNTGILGKAIREADQGRLLNYAAMAAIPGAMLESFSAQLSQDPGADPQRIADKLLELIELPYGSRPARVVIGADFGSGALNQLNVGIQAAALAALQMAQLDPNQVPVTAAA